MRRGTPAALHNGGAALSLFTAADLDDIHLATLETLERTGVWVEADEAIDIFADAGCRVDRDTRIVRMPPDLVSRALDSARRAFRLCGLDPDKDVLLETGRSAVAPFAEPIMVNDLETGEHRTSTKRDVADICRVADALSDIEINLVGVTSRDVPSETVELHNLEAALHNTTKPISLSLSTAHGAEHAFRMAAAVVGGHDRLRERPVVLAATCPVGPMMFPAGFTEVAFACARAGMPVAAISMDMAGASSPVALAGTLVVQNCELLASLVLVQIVNSGNPFMYGTCTTAFDLRLGNAPVGSPESALCQAGTSAMAAYYSIPSWTAGY